MGKVVGEGERVMRWQLGFKIDWGMRPRSMGAYFPV